MGARVLDSTRRDGANVTSITPRQLADRARIRARVRISETDAHTYLEEWREQGIAHEVAPGEWALTPARKAMFSGWAVGIELDDGQDEAA